MALSDFDRSLLNDCLAGESNAWRGFVNRFMGLVIHVVNHSAQSRSIRLPPQDSEDLVAEVFLAILNDDLAVLRNFRGESSLATYLTVVARRVVVHSLIKNSSPSRLAPPNSNSDSSRQHDTPSEQRLSDRDEIERLLGELDSAEAQVVRMFHLEGKSYHEISSETGLPENSVGPTLSRARRKMRERGADIAAN